MLTSTMQTSRRRKKLRHRAFTLLEIIVVVTIIALLATLVAPRFFATVGKQKQKIATADCASIAQQVNIYLLDQGLSSPPDDFELSVLTEGEDAMLAPKDLIDPWDNEYFIRTGIDAVNIGFDIVSYGADGQPGGEGEDADVTN